MSRGKRCPVCGHWTYRHTEGHYEGFQKLTPDSARCSYCDFRYEEHIKYLEIEQVNDYLRHLEMEGLEWVLEER